jgi:hypothetical protein
MDLWHTWMRADLKSVSSFFRRIFPEDDVKIEFMEEEDLEEEEEPWLSKYDEFE